MSMSKLPAPHMKVFFHSSNYDALMLQGVTISNDGATIMRLLDIVHPAAKTLVNISMSQDAEVSLSTSTLHLELDKNKLERLWSTIKLRAF